MSRGDAKSLTQPPRPSAKAKRIVRPSARAHHIYACGRLQRPDQDRRSRLEASNKIKAPVHPVDAVDIGSTWWSVYRLVSRRKSSEAVRRRISGLIGLSLDDPPADTIHKDRATHQRSREPSDLLSEKWRFRLPRDRLVASHTRA